MIMRTTGLGTKQHIALVYTWTYAQEQRKHHPRIHGSEYGQSTQVVNSVKRYVVYRGRECSFPGNLEECQLWGDLQG